MKQKKQKEKGQFFRIGNILWAVKNFWTTDKAFCFFVLIDIPLAILITLAGSYFPKLLIDTMSAGETFEKAAAIIGVYTATMIAMKLLASFSFAQCQGRRYFFANGFQAARAVKHATTDYENLEKQDYKKKYGYAGRDLTNGNASVEMVWGDLQSFFINALGIITLASLMAFLNPLIFAVIIAVSVVSFFLTRWRAKFYEANKDKWEKEERRRGYLERISEDFSRAKDIKLYGMQDWIDGMMRDYQEYVLMWTIRSDRRSLWANIISAVLTLVQDGTAYIFLIGMLFAGELGAGDFVFYFGVVGSVANYLRSVLGNVAALTTRAEKIDYVREYLAIPDTFNHGEGIPLPEHDVKIEFRDVWYRYEGAEDFTLKGVNLTVNKGEKLALVGMNGAGKTTMVKLLCGFYMPTKGEVLINDKPITAYNIDEYYSLISAVFQDINVPAMTICRFVSVVSPEEEIDREKAEKALCIAGLGEKIDALEHGMDTYMGKGIYPDAIDLSGGEKQKLLLARAIYKNGSMLVLDEPTSALDPIAENELYLKYHSLTKEKTSVYISHRFASTRFCDKVALLDDGVIAEFGTHDELMKLDGKYAYMFGVQSQYYKEGEIHA